MRRCKVDANLHSPDGKQPRQRSQWTIVMKGGVHLVDHLDRLAFVFCIPFVSVTVGRATHG